MILLWSMMSEEFKDYYDGIMEMVVVKTNNLPYAKSLVNKNYFRIKTGFYEDTNPETIVEELVFQVKEHLKERGSLILEGVIVESSVTDAPVRQIVRDLVNIIKSKETGNYSLPEDISDGDDFEYNFKNIPFFSVEFDYTEDYNIDDDYLINAVLFNEDFTISIKLIINPKFYPQSMYDIIADLNDVLAHEIEHIYKLSWKRPEEEMDIYSDREDERPQDKEYYLQSHEIPAQFKGLRRINKLRKEKMSKTIRDWFKRNQGVHKLSDRDIEDISTHLSKLFKEKYGRD